MKKFIKDCWLRVLGLIATLILAVGIYGQDYKRVGNKFIQLSHVSVRDTMITDYTIVDGKDTELPVIINKANGRCYTWRISKNGRGYRAYLKAELSKTIAEELRIEYKENEKKK